MKTFIRYIAVAVILIAGYFAMTYMQHRFDHADLKKAVAAVQSIAPHPNSSQTIAEAIASQYRVTTQQIQWSTEIESKLWGTVRVTAKIPGNDDSLTWLVDVSAQQVMPESKAAAQLFR